MNPFSPLKAAWHLKRIEALREGRDIAPTHLQLIISDLCNQDCHFCAYRMEGGFSTANFADEQGNKNPKRFIPTAKCKQILDDAKAIGVRAVEFTGGGEPTVHPDCWEIIAHAQSLGLQTGLVTNGVRLKDWDVIRKLTWLRVSLDAGREETYERIRRSKAWGKVMENLAHLGGLPLPSGEGRGEGRPYVGVGFVVTRENYLELADACRIVRDCGIPYIRVSAMFSHIGSQYYRGIEADVANQRALARCYERSNFKVVDFFGDRIGDLDQAAPDYAFCGYQQFVVYIGGDQKVYTCCTNAYTPHGEIGDLREQSFLEWFTKTRRFDFDARKCHHCQFNNKNKVLNFLLEKDPEHVFFV